MTRVSRTAFCLLAFLILVVSGVTAAAQVDPSLYRGLKWRNVGPFHGGRISSVTGVIGDSACFIAGTHWAASGKPNQRRRDLVASHGSGDQRG